MATDRYTKVVLTIIAAALVWLCVRDVLPATVHARADQGYVRLDVNERQPLPVKLVGIAQTHWTERVNAFDSVQRSQPWEAIPVRQTPQ